MDADPPAASGESILVEVAYARPDRQWLVELQVAPGTTARSAVALSGLSDCVAEIDPATADLGVFGQPVDPQTPLTAGDRVEIYRPLQVDPKAQRRNRARAQRQARR
jgi:putative ubiquitin-RnfH superfamily antitoxin RatB of RatAB toxin-antitoxin module